MNWFKTVAGKNLLEFEKDIIDRFLEEIFGFYALQLSDCDINFLENSRIKNYIYSNGPYKNISFNEDQLPFDSDSIDLVLCLHVFEKITNSKDFIDDLFRVTLPGGYVIISAFNPNSFAGMRNYFAFDNNFPWNTKFIRMQRMQKLLKNTGFTLIEGSVSHFQSIFFDKKFSFNKKFENIGNRWFPLLGNIYFVVAQKKITKLLPIKLQFEVSKKPGFVINKNYD